MKKWELAVLKTHTTPQKSYPKQVPRKYLNQIGLYHIIRKILKQKHQSRPKRRHNGQNILKSLHLKKSAVMVECGLSAVGSVVMKTLRFWLMCGAA